MNLQNFHLVLAQAGGLFAFLTFVHFFADWLWQSHAEAMKKATDSGVRSIHCAVYTSFFALPLIFMGLSWGELAISLGVLFWSHFFEDTYIPVMIWAKYIRRAPEFAEVSTLTSAGELPAQNGAVISISADNHSVVQNVKVVGVINANAVNITNDTAAFIKWASTPLGKILMIAVDQIIHLMFLWVPVYFALN